ncbi:GNAT family N-acetyltransferase [Streptomyces sp. NPDC046203]|uniref:GNAT family N-acetyltransferase n=1 Tax=Streptomyces sp. NPDC046203 TaxID=3154602 RepID=UPI0033C5C353
MSWHFTDDHAAFRHTVHPHLSSDPVRNTALLTLLDAPGRITGPRGWWRDPVDGRVAGVVVVLPGRAVQLGMAGDEAARALAGVLPGVGEVAAVRGEAGAVEVFAEATGRAWAAERGVRLFRLGELVPPEPAPAGAVRLAEPADVPLAVGWTREFARVVGEDPDADYTAAVETRVADGRLWLWEVAGEPVAMASVSPVVAGQARVSLVYTPPGHRGRGYAGGVTGAASRAALDAGAAHVVLFTDRANPTSNALYQRLGFRPVVDHTAVAFI